VNDSIVRPAHQASARFSREESEFAATGLTPQFREGCIAPFVAECTVQVAAEFVRTQEIPENGTVLAIARIIAVYLPESCISADGYVDHALARSIACVGLDSYLNATPIERLSYAQPHEPVTPLN